MRPHDHAFPKATMDKIGGNINRRTFLKDTAVSAAALGALSLAGPLSATAASQKLRLAMVGTGSRGIGMWGTPLVEDYPDLLEFVGLCDINPERSKVAQVAIGTKAPTFTDFDQMIKTTRPDVVMVTTIDGYHSEYVCRAMELGCDVVCEKPLCTRADQAQAIIDAQKKTGRRLTVTFNARHGGSSVKLKELLMSGEIGEIYEANYDEFLDRSHGADYFRRWHAFKQNSGTLFCHKASHHFDELNWWVDSDPVEVMAHGRLNVYGHNGPFRHANCRACIFKNKCGFFWDITKVPWSMQLYVECEDSDGYYRDGCVYRSGIDIYDTMTAQIKYANGALVSYSLNAAVPYEGQFIVFNGSQGRIELRNYNQQPWQVAHDAEIRLTKIDGSTTVIPIQAEAGEHGGSDKRIRDMIFRPSGADPLKQKAGMRAGLMSSLIGIAGYTSIEEREPVRIADLVNWG